MEAGVASYQIGDRVRMLQVPLYLYTDNPVDKDAAEFIGRCLGTVLRVEDFGEHGQLERG